MFIHMYIIQITYKYIDIHEIGRHQVGQLIVQSRTDTYLDSETERFREFSIPTSVADSRTFSVDRPNGLKYYFRLLENVPRRPPGTDLFGILSYDPSKSTATK